MHDSSGSARWKRRPYVWSCFIAAALICPLTASESAPGPPQPPPSPDANITSYLVTIRIGGPQAEATPGLVSCTNAVVTRELGCQDGNCRVLEAANVTKCRAGAPSPAPLTDIYISPDQDTTKLAAYLKQVPQSNYDGGPDLSQVASTYATVSASSTSKPPTVSGRRLHASLPGADGLPGVGRGLKEAIPPRAEQSSGGGCSASSEMTIYFAFPASTDDSQWNHTLALFSSGIFLSKMQGAQYDLETVEFLSFQSSGGAPGPAVTGPVKSFPDATDVPGQQQPAIANNTNSTAFEFSLNLVGQDAQVTNDSVLVVLYRIVSHPAPDAGPGSQWLSPSNLIITSIVQNDLQAATGPPPGLAGRRLQQNPADVFDCNSGVLQPSLTATFRLLAVAKQDLRKVQAVISAMVVSGQLLDGVQAAGFQICSVNVTNYNLLPGPLAPPPSAGPAATPTNYSSRQSSNHSVVVLAISIAVPVAVVFVSALLAAIWIFKRRERHNKKKRARGKLRGQDSAFEKTGFLTLSESKFSDKPEPSAQSILALRATPQQSSFSKHNLLDMPWSDWKIDPAELSIVARPDGSEWLLGSGASGKVYKALRNGVQIVAVKVFKEEMTRGAINSFTSPYHAAQFRQEISILKSCHDKNIVQFIGACLAVGQTILVTEYLENGDLYKAINSQQGNRYHWYRMQLPDGRPLPNSGMARRVALDVARGLHFLHTKKIVHFDLKSANILLARDFTAKLADVGLARVLHDDVLSTRREVGTFAWAAPEVLLGQRITESADIYSFGVLLHELSAIESPRQRQLRKLSIPEEAPAEVGDLIDRCLDLNPSNRPTARELVAVLSLLPATPPFAPVVESRDEDPLV